MHEWAERESLMDTNSKLKENKKIVNNGKKKRLHLFNKIICFLRLF